MKPDTGSNIGGTKLPPFIRALLEPRAYPHPTTHIELRQTHISYVLLTGEYAYKIKKDVNFGFVDYSTLEKRRHFCHEEVRLNSRLCPEIYLGVVEVRGEGKRAWIGDEGDLIDYAVMMVQLPEDRLMDRLLDANNVSCTMVERLAEKLVDFYHRAGTGPDVAKFGEPRWILANTEENFFQTAPFIGRTISSDQYRIIKEYTDRFISDHLATFQRRVAGGFVREGHGDLRPENVCYSDGICIFDCVEFNERLRCGDIASDIAFLTMEMDMAGHTELSSCFTDAYIAASGDIGALDVLDFYKVYRAYVRGKVESFKLNEPEIPEDEKQKSREIAKRYFGLAASYIERAHPVIPEYLEPPEWYEEE